jgi:hypothetical protein
METRDRSRQAGAAMKGETGRTEMGLAVDQV